MDRDDACEFRGILEKLAAFADSLPMPHFITECEKKVATLIIEKLIPATERSVLIEASLRKRQQMVFFVVALMSHLEREKHIDAREVHELIRSRQTIVRLVLEQ